MSAGRHPRVKYGTKCEIQQLTLCPSHLGAPMQQNATLTRGTHSSGRARFTALQSSVLFFTGTWHPHFIGSEVSAAGCMTQSTGYDRYRCLTAYLTQRKWTIAIVELTVNKEYRTHQQIILQGIEEQGALRECSTFTQQVCRVTLNKSNLYN